MPNSKKLTVAYHYDIRQRYFQKDPTRAISFKPFRIDYLREAKEKVFDRLNRASGDFPDLQIAVRGAKKS